MVLLAPRGRCVSSFTRAIPVYKGKTYHLTRRCARRLRRLRPDAQTTSIVKFALFHAAKECGIEVHAACFSTTHFHLVITDPEGRLPDFMQRMNSVIARALNHAQGVKGQFWEEGSYTRVEIATRERLLSTLAYVTLNPVKDGLVSSPERWPGFLTRPCHAGCTFRAHRPATAFFGGNTRGGDPSALAEESSLPDSVSMKLVMPTTFFAPHEQDLYRRLYQRAVDEALQAIFLERRGKPFLGRAYVRSIDPLTPPPTEPPPSGRPSPVNGPEEVVRAHREAHRLWSEAYVEARDTWGEDPHAVFPAGSWLLAQRYGAPTFEQTTS